jgi:RHS repeat-associated protein
LSQTKVPGSNGTPPEITLSYGEATDCITTGGYTYDLNGNITAMPGISGIQWDVFDRMTQATANGSTTSYTYGAFGRRVAQETPNGTNWFFYDMSGRLLVTYPWANGYQPVRTVYFAGQRVGQYGDGVGSTRYTAPIVTPPFTYSHYYPFGEEITSTANDRYKFAETFRDADTGLDYALNRYYASGIGRFLSVDPVKGSARPGLPQSWNRYGYVLNDPVNLTDPTGTNWPEDDDGEARCNLDPQTAEPPDVLACLALEMVFMQGMRPQRTRYKPTLWDRAMANLTAGANLVGDLLDFGGLASKPDCRKDLDAIQSQLGVSPATISDFVQYGTTWNSADKNSTAAIGLFVPATADYNTIEDRMPTLTISQYVSGATKAASAPPGSALAGNIYFQAQYAATLSPIRAAALLMHEVLHTAGAVDSDILKALGFDPTKVDANEIKSVEITNKLLKDCFK